MNIGLYFGSFNPVHTGHLIIANHILEQTLLDKIWFVVSPQNPLKPSHTLLNEFDRFHLVELAIADNPGFRASNVEFHLPKPSYTVNTLAYLSEKFPLEQFTVIIGSDSYQNLPRWKNAEILLENYPIIVYQRPGFPVDALPASQQVTSLQAPMLDISSTFIREQIKQEKSIKYLVTPEVEAYIKANGYYRK